MIFELLITLIVLIFSLVIYNNVKKPANYPPGPWGLPLIGSIPTGLDTFNEKLSELQKQHDIISWRIGTKLFVIIFDYNLIRDAYQNQFISDRPDFKSITYIRTEYPIGIILSAGDHWRTNRRFALKHLRDFGMGKPKLLEVGHFESDNLVNELKKQVGTPAPVSDSLLISILNITWQMVGSKRYDFDDENIHTFNDLINQTHLHGAKLLALDIFPWIKKVVPQFLLNKIFQFHLQTELSKKIKKYFTTAIEEHLLDLDETNPRDYIDAYLIEMEKNKSNPESTLSNEDLTVCMSDLFEGATETTSLSIHWAILYLAKYSRVQSRLQNEIDDILPKGTSFSMDDKTRLPYTEAFIHEVLRNSSVITVPPREANNDTKIGDYFIPKGTVVQYHTLLVHLNSKYFDSPEDFRPERFLDSTGNFSPPKEGFLSFGYGKRVCIGETIARMQLFVFITKLVQNFHFEYPPGEEFNLEGVLSPFFRPPKGHPNVIITLR